MDVYLQPHSDDVCFSLGALAHRRRCGILLTAFAIAAYVATRPGADGPNADVVTKTRRAEDAAFSKACGLEARFLEVMGASMLGHHPFELAWVEENARRIEDPLMDALIAPPAVGVAKDRPWLFSPCGIGGHVDHVAIRMVVARHYDRLAPLYRLGFYEDLHYASEPMARDVGLQSLQRALGARPLQRHAWPLDGGQSTKLDLIGLYASQFIDLPRSLERFTPAARFPAAPHEAVWSEEPSGPWFT